MYFFIEAVGFCWLLTDIMFGVIIILLRASEAVK